MKKITIKITAFLLFMLASFQVNAQLIQPGFYRIQILGDFEGENLVISPRTPGQTSQQPILAVELDENDTNQIFEVVYTGDNFDFAAGGATQVLNLVSVSGSGNIETANQNNDGERAITNGSGRANLRGATTQSNEAGLFDDFYLQQVPENPEAFRIRTAHTPFNGEQERRLLGANSNSGTRFLNFGGGSGTGLDQFTFIPAEFEALSTGDNSVEATALKAFPNPSSDGVFNLTVETGYTVYSLLGKQVLKGSGASVNLSGLSKGLYILKTDAGQTVRLIF